MLVVFQFPISDARPFAELKERLAVPHWPNPVTQIKPEFIHHFGRTVDRRGGADNAWTDEMAFCLARRAIRLPALECQRVGPPAQKFRPKAAFRRLFSDGRAVARLEVGISHNPHFGGLQQVTPASIIQSAADLCNIGVMVGADGKTRPILRQGDAIAGLYQRATSRVASATPTNSHGLVRAGRPLVMVETPDQFTDFNFAGFTSVNVEKTRGALVSFGRIRSKAGVADVWLMHRGSASQSDLRSLRLCLLRLHAEQECLDHVLNLVVEGTIPDTTTVDGLGRIEDYLNKSTRLINRAAWGGISQSAILTAYDAAETVIPTAQRSELVDRVANGKRQVWRKVEDYQARRSATKWVAVTNVNTEGGMYVEKNIAINTTVSGQNNTVVVAEYMNNVTTNVGAALQKSAAPSEVQELIKTLTAQLKEISDKVDAQRLQQMGSDVEALAKEAGSPAPRRRWYEVSLEGLKEAAEAVGELGAPIAATVKKLWPLLMV